MRDPGPPPRHYRAPGSPPTGLGPLPGQPLGVTRPSPAPGTNDGITAGAALVIALVTLVIGLVMGFFLGRAADGDEAASSVTILDRVPSSTTTSRPPGDTIPQVPPVDPEAPPSTDLDPSSIGSIDDPIPSGQAYVLGLYEIEVVAVERDAGATLEEHDPFNRPAPSGQQHVLVRVSIRYTDAEGVGNPAAIPFFLSDGNADWNDFEATCGLVPDSILGAGLIEQGDVATGNTCFTVPADVADDVVLGTEGFDGPVYFDLG